MPSYKHGGMLIDLDDNVGMSQTQGWKRRHPSSSANDDKENWSPDGAPPQKRTRCDPTGLESPTPADRSESLPRSVLTDPPDAPLTLPFGSTSLAGMGCSSLAPDEEATPKDVSFTLLPRGASLTGPDTFTVDGVVRLVDAPLTLPPRGTFLPADAPHSPPTLFEEVIPDDTCLTLPPRRMSPGDEPWSSDSLWDHPSVAPLSGTLTDILSSSGSESFESFSAIGAFESTT